MLILPYDFRLDLGIIRLTIFDRSVRDQLDEGGYHPMFSETYGHKVDVAETKLYVNSISRRRSIT